MKKVFKVIVAVILFFLVCAFVVLANCFGSTMSAKADTPTTINLDDYNYTIPMYYNYTKSTFLTNYNISSTQSSTTYYCIQNDAYNYQPFKINNAYYYLAMNITYSYYSSSSSSLSYTLYIYDNYNNIGSTSNYFAYISYYFDVSYSMFRYMSITLKTQSTSNYLLINKMINEGFSSDSGVIMTINSTNYKKWVNTTLKTLYKTEIGAQTAYYNEGYKKGVQDGQKEIIENPNDFSLFTSTQYQNYGQNQYNDGFTDGSDSTSNYTTSWFLGIFKGLAQFFAIPIFGQITFGTLVLIPFAISLAWFIIRTFRGGGGS